MQHGRTTARTVNRFTSKGSSETLVDLIGRWLQVDKPHPIPKCIAFDDGMIVINDSKQSAERVTSEDKDKKHNCYVYMSGRLSEKPPEWAYEQIKTVLAMCWSDNEPAWNIDTAYEANQSRTASGRARDQEIHYS